MLWIKAFGDLVLHSRLARPLEIVPTFESSGDPVLCSKSITIKLNNCFENQSFENSTIV
jgi:hypothetical protein